MAIYSSGNQISLQGTSDTNPTGQTFHLDTTITSASTSCTLVGFTRTTELGDNFYGTENTLSGTIYGFKTAQTSEYSGSARLARGFDDTNPQVATNSAVKGAGFFVNSGWFGSSPHNSFSGEVWWTSAGVVGVSLGVDENALGSISTQSYTGGGSVGTLEVHQFGWFNNASSAYPNGTTLNTESEGNWIMLVLKNTSSSPPNSDDSFYSVQINGQEFLRSDAATTTQSSNAAYDSNVSSGTHYYRTWRWDAADVTDSDLTAIGTTGSKTFKLSKSASSTLNTGIAEEMGGADSSNVKMSDYFKGGTFHKTLGIPEQGNEISFSDFFDKTFTPLYLYQVSYKPDYWDRGVNSSVAERFSGWSDRSDWMGNVQYDGHRGSGESSDEPTSSEREFPDGVTFCNLSNSGSNKLKFSALTANGGYVFTGNLNPFPALYTLSVTYPGNVTSTATNSGWTRLRAWEVGNSGIDASNPSITLNRTDATFSETYYSGSNITEILYVWPDEDATFGTGYSNTYSIFFGNNSTSSSNSSWLVEID